jgi:ribosomal protein S18 acetylase RimI-like enzyme
MDIPTSTESQQYTFSLDANEQRQEYISNSLRAFNQPHVSPLWQARPQPQAPLQIYVLDDHSAVLGGLTGRTNSIPEWLEIVNLWVAEHVRRHGLGRELMRRAEEEAKQHGCRYARLATSDYQAPEFYYKLGYTLYGKLENCPRGETVYYFCKELFVIATE